MQVKEEYLGLLDHSIQRTDTTSITSRHPIYFIHNKAGLIGDGNSKGVRSLMTKK
jgi:hypothetical protein